MEPVFIGIDPGQGGGIACIVGEDVRAVKMPETERDVLDFLRNCLTLSDGPVSAALEKVHSSPQMGVSSSFKFGCGFGGLRMALFAVGIAFDEVTPQRWQKMLGCLSQGDKNVTKGRAQALFPNIKMTHALADALLIAEYCRRVKLGQLNAEPQAGSLLPKAKKTRFKKQRQPGLF
jgi:crossover junction endodeoxyribonuclease RuvC